MPLEETVLSSSSGLRKRATSSESSSATISDVGGTLERTSSPPNTSDVGTHVCPCNINSGRDFPWRLFFGCMAFRAVNSLVVRTSFNPDEYWQSLEVAHRLVFGYGYLTWEWAHAIRGYAHPLLFAALYKLLHLLGLDTPLSLSMGPRLMQAVFAAAGDVYIYLLAGVLLGRRAAFWTLFCQLTNWFTFYCGVRTFSNCLEADLAAASFFYWAQASKQPKSPHLASRALALAAAACVVRPTSAIMWLAMGVRHLAITRQKLPFLALQAVPIGLLSLGVGAVIDRWGFGRWELVPLNFVRFNVLKKGGEFYGTHPWHWYFSQGFPAMLTTQTPLWLLGVWWRRGIAWPFLVTIWTLAVHSCLGHKEFRFVLPVLPLALVYAGHALATLEGRMAARAADDDTHTARSDVPRCVPGAREQAGLAGASWKDNWAALHEGTRHIAAPSSEAAGCEAGAGDVGGCTADGTSAGTRATLHEAGTRHQVQRGWSVSFRCLLALLLTTQCLMAAYFSLVHQRGAVAVTGFLAREAAAGRVREVLFLMPCHSTPFYSHVHRPVPMRILECPPSDDPDYIPESTRFFKDPTSYLQALLGSGPSGMVPARDGEFAVASGIDLRSEVAEEEQKPRQAPRLPSHLVMFDSLESRIASFLQNHSYVLVARHFYAHFPVDAELQGYVLVFREAASSAAGTA